MLVMDHEIIASAFSYADTSAAFAELKADPRAEADMQPSLYARSASNFVHTDPDYISSMVDFSYWVELKDAQVLRYLFEYAEAVWPGIMSSQYQEITLPGDVVTMTGITDVNGFPLIGLPSAARGGTVMSPSSYLDGTGNLGGIFYPSADIYWINFLAGLNSIRACVATGEKVVPWINAPRPGHEWLWSEVVRQVADMGISEVLYFNPEADTTPDQEAFAEYVFSSVHATPRPSITVVPDATPYNSLSWSSPWNSQRVTRPSSYGNAKYPFRVLNWDGDGFVLMGDG
jgi:hypothetical protein